MPINRGKDKDVRHIYDGILLSHKKEQSCAICRDMDGPRGCHTEGTKSKEKNKYHILMHMCGIQKNGIDKSICKAEIETDVQNEQMDTKGGRGWWEELEDWG